MEMTDADRLTLINAIATREGTARQLAEWYGYTVDELKSFVAENEEEITYVRNNLREVSENGEPTPTELGDLWISKKMERLTRYQEIADRLYADAQSTTDATVLRELRFYMTAAANELGQLLHRGSGESGSDKLSVDIQGVDLENLR